ncbi:hypothetical protein OB13_11070 [Pontibacter sp. HJ8]
MQIPQLVLEHAGTIAICLFSKEENKFGVEATYNIRYQMLKSRIDKMLLKSGYEMRTLPGAITFV